MKTKRVLIVGGGPSRKLATLRRDEELWGIPQPGATRTFQMHPPAILTNQERENLEAEVTIPVYTLKDERGRQPRSVVYPLARVETMAPAAPFASTFDYMMALAVLERFRFIRLAGVDLQLGGPRERLCEHVSLAYWIGFARARGIGVEVLGHVLRFPYRYGYDYQAERTWAQRMAFWAAIGNLSFQFDDGLAKTAVQGWAAEFSEKKVSISI